MTQTFTDHVEKLKSDYTDKYVVVDASRAELRRFQNLTGQVKTVNMSGRALVEFEGNNNIGWFDIELDYIKVVDKPAPEPVAKQQAVPAKKAPAAKKPAKKGLSPLELARMQGAAKKSPDGDGETKDRRASTAEILAAARVKKGSAAPSTASAPAKPAGKMSTDDILAAARGGAGAAPAAKAASAAAPSAAKASDPQKMSTADILAAARGNAPEAKQDSSPAAEAETAPTQESPTQESPAETAPAEKPAAAAPTATTGELPTTTADIIAWCRQTDAN